MSKLEIIAKVKSLGYTKFENKCIFLRSSLSHFPATISNFDKDPVIYSFANEEGEIFYMWSFIFDKINKKTQFDDLDDFINFKSQVFYKNDDSFLIPNVEDIEELFTYSEANNFIRPIINIVDNRTDLGYKRFIISNAGILFSIHEKLEHKLLDFDTILFNEIKLIQEKTLIGTIGSPFEITTCHLIPIGSGF